MDKAEENYRHVLELDPRKREALKYLATLYSLGQPEATLRSFKRALTLNPTLQVARSGFEKVRKTLQQSGE